MEGDKAVENEKELTSTNSTTSNSSDMEELLSSTKEKSDSSTNDTLPTSSTDASTSVKSLHLVSDDPISSTSSEMDSGKPNVDKSTNNIVEKACSNFDTEAELLEMSIGVQASEKIEENVDDLVNDLETLLGESTDSFTTSVKSAEVIEENIVENEKCEVDVQQDLCAEKEETMDIASGDVDLQLSGSLKDSIEPVSTDTNNDSFEEKINSQGKSDQQVAQTLASEEQQKIIEEAKPVPEINIRRKTVEQDLEKVVCLSEESSDSDSNGGVSNPNKQPENDSSNNEQTALIQVAEEETPLAVLEVPEEDIPAIDDFLSLQPEVVSSVVSADSGSNLETILAVASLENESVSDIRVERRLSEKEIQEMEAIRMAVASITDSSQDTYDSFLVDNSVAMDSCAQEVAENAQEFPTATHEVISMPKEFRNATLLISSSTDSQAPVLTGEDDLSKEVSGNISDGEICEKSTFANDNSEPVLDAEVGGVKNSQYSDELDGTGASEDPKLIHQENESQDITDVIADNSAKIEETCIDDNIVLESTDMSKEVSADTEDHFQETGTQIAENKGDGTKMDSQKLDPSAEEKNYVSETGTLMSKEVPEDIEKGTCSEYTSSTKVHGMINCEKVCGDPSDTGSLKQPVEEYHVHKEDEVPEGKCATQEDESVHLEKDNSVQDSEKQKIEIVEPSSDMNCGDIIQSAEPQNDNTRSYASISEENKISVELESNSGQTTIEIKSDTVETSEVSTSHGVSDDTAEGETSQKMASEVAEETKENYVQIANPEKPVEVSMLLSEDIAPSCHGVSDDTAEEEATEKMASEIVAGTKENPEKTVDENMSVNKDIAEKTIFQTEPAGKDLSEHLVEDKEKVTCNESISVTEEVTVLGVISGENHILLDREADEENELSIPENVMDPVDTNILRETVDMPTSVLPEPVEEKPINNVTVESLDIHEVSSDIKSSSGEDALKENAGVMIEETKEETAHDANQKGVGMLATEAMEIRDEGHLEEHEESNQGRLTASEPSCPVSETVVERDEMSGLGKIDPISTEQPIESATTLLLEAHKGDAVEESLQIEHGECSTSSEKSVGIFQNIVDSKDKNMEEKAITAETENCLVIESASSELENHVKLIDKETEIVEQEDTGACIQSVDQLEGTSTNVNVLSTDVLLKNEDQLTEETKRYDDVQTVDKEKCTLKNGSVNPAIAKSGSISLQTDEKEIVVEPAHVKEDDKACLQENTSLLVDEVAAENKITSQDEVCKEDDLPKSGIVVEENKICDPKLSTEEVILKPPVGEPGGSSSEELIMEDEKVSVLEDTFEESNSNLKKQIQESGKLETEDTGSLSDHIETMQKSNLDKPIDGSSVTVAVVSENVGDSALNTEKIEIGASETMDCTETQNNAETNSDLGTDCKLVAEGKLPDSPEIKDENLQVSEEKDISVNTLSLPEKAKPLTEEAVVMKNINQANDDMEINAQSADQKPKSNMPVTEMVKDSQGPTPLDEEKNISGHEDLDKGNEELRLLKATQLATDKIVEEKEKFISIEVDGVSNISEEPVKGDKLSISKSLGDSSENDEGKNVLISDSDNGLTSKCMEQAYDGNDQKTEENRELPSSEEISKEEDLIKETPLDGKSPEGIQMSESEVLGKNSSDVEQLVKENDIEAGGNMEIPGSEGLNKEERQEHNTLSRTICIDNVDTGTNNELPATEEDVVVTKSTDDVGAEENIEPSTSKEPIADERQEDDLSVTKGIVDVEPGENPELTVSEKNIADKRQEENDLSVTKGVVDVEAGEHTKLPVSEENIADKRQEENDSSVTKGIVDVEPGQNPELTVSEKNIADKRQEENDLSVTKGVVDVEAGEHTKLPVSEENIADKRQEENDSSVTKGIVDVEAGENVKLPVSKNIADKRQEENDSSVTEGTVDVGARENVELPVSEEHIAEERSLRSRTRRGNKISEPLSINVEELEKKDKVYSPKITIKPVKVPDEEVSTTSDVEGNKGSLKMTITKQSDKMRSILKVFNPEEDVENTQNQDEPIPKLIIKPKIQQVEQQHSPKMTTRSSKTYSPTNTRCSSPRVSIKPVTKPPEANPEVLSPLKITFKPVVKPEDVNKKSPKALKEQEQKNTNPKITIKPIPKPSEVDKEEATVTTTPKVIIKPIKRHLEENDAENEPERSSPKITIKPVIKLDEQDSNHLSNVSAPKLKIKPIKKQDDVETGLEKDEGSPKISIKPIVKPPEHLEEEDEEVKERIVLKINKGNLPTPTKDPKKREYPEDDKSEKVGIKLKFSTTGGHTHIVQEGEESNKRQRKDSGYSSGAAKKDVEETPHKRSLDEKLPDKNKRLRSAITPDKMTEGNNSDHVIAKEKVNPAVLISENSRSHHTSDIAASEDFRRESPDISKIADLASQTTHIEATSILTVGIATPSVSPAPKKRGRPRKATLEIREELKDLPTSSQAPSLSRSEGPSAAEAGCTPGSEGGTPKAMSSPSEGRPKRSCRGQNVIAALGIKPRKSRGGGRGRGGKVNMGDRESSAVQSPSEPVQSVSVKPEKEENVSKTNLKLIQKTGREEIQKQREEPTKQKEEDGNKKGLDEELKHLETVVKKELEEVADSKRKKDDDEEQSPPKKKKEDKTPPRKLEVTTRRQRAQQQKGSEEAEQEEKVPEANPKLDQKKPVVNQTEGGSSIEAIPSLSAVNTAQEVVVISTDDDSCGKEESVTKSEPVEVAQKSPLKSSVEQLSEYIFEEKRAELEVDKVDTEKSEVQQIDIDEHKEDINPKLENTKIEEGKVLVEENKKDEKTVEVASAEDDSDEDSEAERRREWILMKKQEAIKKCRAKRMEKLARAAELKKKRQEQAAQQREARKAAEEAERAAAEKLRATKRYGRYGLPKPQISLIDEPVQETDGTVKSHMGLFNPEIERINITQPMLIDYDSEKAGHLKHLSSNSGLIDSPYDTPLKLGRSIGAEDVVMLDEETRMSADFRGSRAQTPAKPARLPPDTMVEDSQGSVGTEGGKSRSSKAPKMEVFQDSESTVFTADQLAEYSWNGQGPYMLQEQVAQYLGIKSFKRKYPHITRRPVDMQERDYLKENGLATEAQCDLGLTAVIAQDILDIMYTDFQDKYEEYCRSQREKQARELANKQKFLNQFTFKPGFDKLDILEQVVQSAAAWNQHLNKARREQRRAYMDLQNLTVQYPKSRVKVIPTPKIGHYPVALVPGQFTDYYKEYTPTELNNLPLNTMCYDEIKIPGMETESEESSSGSDSDSESCSGSSDSNSSCEDEDCKDCIKKIKSESHAARETDSDDVVIIENDASSSDSVVLVSVTAAPVTA